MREIKLNPGGTAPPDENYEAFSNTSITQIGRYVSNINFIRLEESKIAVSVIERVPKAVDLPLSIIQVTQGGLDRFPLMYEISVLNVGAYKTQSHKSKPIFLVTLNSELREALNNGEYAFYDDKFIGLEEFIIAAKMLRKYAAYLISSVPYNGDSTVMYTEYVDIEKLGGRNLYALCDQIDDLTTRAAMRLAIKARYKGIMPKVPTNFNQDDLPTVIKDSYREYKTYTVPYNKLEMNLNDFALEIFQQTYTHPRKMIADIEKFVSDGIRIDPHLTDRAHAANSDVRIFNQYFVSMKVSDMYACENVRNELRYKIDQLTHVDVFIVPISKAVKIYNDALHTNIQVSSTANQFALYIDDVRLAEIIGAIFRTLVNPNLYAVDIPFSTASEADSLFSLVGLVLTQLFIPPTTIVAVARLRINNAIACEAVKYNLAQAGFIRLRNDLHVLFPHVTLPDTSNRNSWLESTVDFAYMIYRTTSSYPQRYILLNELFAIYFNRVQVITLADEIEYGVKNKMREQRSLSAPWLMGAEPRYYLRDTRYDSFRKNRNMEPNGALCISTDMHYDEEPDTRRIQDRVQLIRLIYRLDAPYDPTIPSVSGIQLSQIRQFLFTVTQKGVSAAATLIRMFNYHSMEYSTSICCDGMDRACDRSYKTTLPIAPQYMLSLFVIMDPSHKFMNPMTAPLYDGITLAMDIRLFQLVYQDVLNRVNVRGPPKKLASNEQYEKLANDITGMILGSNDFDIRSKFGYAEADNSTWRAFLDDSKNAKAGEIPIFAHYMAYIDSMTKILRSHKRMTHIVDHFFLVRNAIMGDTPNFQEVIAASTVCKEADLNVGDRIIRTVDEYLDLRHAIIDDTEAEYETKFDKMWYSLPTVDISERYSQEKKTKIEAIRVNMRAKVIVNYVIEDGTFLTRTQPVGTDVEKDFHSNFTNINGNIYNIPIFKIPITIILNNVATQNAGKRRVKVRRTESVISSVPYMTNMIVPLEDFYKVIGMSYEQLLTFFTSDVSVRKRTYEIMNDFSPEFVRTST